MRHRYYLEYFFDEAIRSLDMDFILMLKYQKVIYQ